MTNKRRGIAMNTRGRLVIIIDEDARVRTLQALDLAEKGYEVVTTGNTTWGRKIIRVLEPDAVVIDPYLGKQERWDLVADIRKRDMRVCVLLCLSSPVGKNGAFLALADDYVVKNSSNEDLVLKLEHLLSRRVDVAETHEARVLKEGHVATKSHVPCFI